MSEISLGNIPLGKREQRLYMYVINVNMASDSVLAARQAEQRGEPAPEIIAPPKSYFDGDVYETMDDAFIGFQLGDKGLWLPEEHINNIAIFGSRVSNQEKKDQRLKKLRDAVGVSMSVWNRLNAPLGLMLVNVWGNTPQTKNTRIGVRMARDMDELIRETERLQHRVDLFKDKAVAHTNSIAALPEAARLRLISGNNDGGNEPDTNNGGGLVQL
jgi:hypothetical protein